MYLLGCVSIMVYNAMVIIRKNNSSKAMVRNTDRWAKEIKIQLEQDEYELNPKHEKNLRRYLRNVEQLIAYSNALGRIKNEDYAAALDRYMVKLVENDVFVYLTADYRDRRTQERAYLAFFISQYPQVAKNSDGISSGTVDNMVSYIEDSDIYCRVNVLKALSHVGDMYGVANVLQFFSERRYFIHHKLLADELLCFVGNKEDLAKRLWSNHRIWNPNIMLGVVNFITMCSGAFDEEFLPVLKNPSANVEIRLAIMRYYRKNIYSQVHPILLEYLSQTENYDFAIVAAFVLDAYPSPVTTAALKAALESDKWHVRYNAITSLVNLGEYSEDMVNELIEHDNDALQILQYKLEHAGGKEIRVGGAAK